MELLDKFVGYRIFSYRELIGNKRIQVGADIAYLVFHRLYTLDISTWIADGRNREEADVRAYGLQIAKSGYASWKVSEVRSN